LEGEPKLLVDGIAVTVNTYKETKKILFDRYGNTNRINKQQAHELNHQIPEFRLRNIDKRQRFEQVGMHTEGTMVNNPNQEN
jgi:hypothetical protein